MGYAANPDGLPALAFGESRAWRTCDPKVAADRASTTVASLNVYGPAESGAFAHKYARVRINGLELTASASSPLRLGCDWSSDLHLFVPFAGSNSTSIGRRRYDWNAGEKAALVAGCGPRLGVSDTRSVLVARLDPQRLAGTARAMRGGAGTPDPGQDEIRLLALRHGETDFAQAFQGLCNIVDASGGQTELLEKLGLDDLLYRNVVALLHPEMALSDEEPKATAPRDAVDAVCDAVKSRLGRPLTLTEMEQLCGLSRRALQYAFKKRFGCSPMVWQQQERLRLARRRLVEDDAPVGITGLAFDLGFPSSSHFALYYRRLFGEKPSETLARSTRARRTSR